MPFELDISALRATGLQPGEKELPEQTTQLSEPQRNHNNGVQCGGIDKFVRHCCCFRTSD